jgi:FkbH-like protein
MYESEANRIVEAASQIPAEILCRFGELKQTVTARTVLPWGEHCTECVWPSCYTSCDLYSPREDLRCRRFVDGMVRLDLPEGLNSYILKIRFKRWGKLWTVGNTRLHSPKQAKILERRDIRVASGIQFVPLSALKKRLTVHRYNQKKRWASRLSAPDGGATPSVRPNCFLLECYNPNDAAIQVSLTMRALEADRSVPFQTMIDLLPGFNRTRVAFSEIAGVMDTAVPFGIDMIPNDVLDGTVLYFGFMDFVHDSSIESSRARLCKCVVWDLDNTMWDGILVEDGPDRLRLKPNVVNILKELDNRGILLSIATKNNPEEAMDVLKRFGVAEYFLCPQVSWSPKGNSLRRIAKTLNIGLDSFIFVDDSPFERAQVQAVCPEVTVMDARDYKSLLDRKECQVPVTEESRKRRQLYREQEVRQSVQETFGDDYFAFLRECHLELTIRPMTDQNLQRVHELTQRTNQMNFSGNRYERHRLEEILASEHLETYVLDCKDRFGNYGTVGFSLVDRRENRMLDLMFSCRIQAKRIEHAFLTYILQEYVIRRRVDFYVNYRKTPRNAPSGKVFDDFGFENVAHEGEVSLLRFRQGRIPPDDRVVDIKSEIRSIERDRQLHDVHCNVHEALQ